MVGISIACLIFRSPAFADWIWNSVAEHTPKLARGDAEFFFVANDATEAVVQHLQVRGYPFYRHDNAPVSDAELFRRGYGAPAHMHAVYCGYNETIRRAKGEMVVLLNSDNFVAIDWLENLLKYSHPNRVVCSKLVERWHPVFSLFPGAFHGEFGASLDSFDKSAFLAFAERAKVTGIEPGGAYMPCLFHRDMALKAGLYPEGNLAGQNFQDIVEFGDETFFRKLREIGVDHVTALDSIVYHLKEGERAAAGKAVCSADPAALSLHPAGPATELPAKDPLFVVTSAEKHYLTSQAPTAPKVRFRSALREKTISALRRTLPAPVLNALVRTRRLLLAALSFGAAGRTSRSHGA